jgi:hypothetical protein
MVWPHEMRETTLSVCGKTIQCYEGGDGRATVPPSLLFLTDEVIP